MEKGLLTDPVLNLEEKRPRMELGVVQRAPDYEAGLWEGGFTSLSFRFLICPMPPVSP